MFHSDNTAETLLLSEKKIPSIPVRHTKPESPFSILLAEDETSDIVLTEIALDESELDYELYTVKNGMEAVSYLRRQASTPEGRMPNMLMLDLSLPNMDGFEVLTQLAELAIHSNRFSDLPIVILTGDSNSTFLKRCYGLHIVAYIVKPCSAKNIHETLRRIRIGGK